MLLQQLQQIRKFIFIMQQVGQTLAILIQVNPIEYAFINVLFH